MLPPDRVSLVPADLLARLDAAPRVDEPQLAWELSIAGYLYLGGLGAGAFVVAIVAGWLGFGLAPELVAPMDGWAWDWSPALVLWGPFVTAAGAALLIFHLGRNWFLFFTAARNPKTSWLARGFLILSGFIAVGCVVALVAVFLPSLPERLSWLWTVLEAVGVVLAVATAVYTGLLLKSMKYIPAWNAPLIPVLFLASALSTGASGVIVGAAIYRLLAVDAGSADQLTQWLEVVEPSVIVAEAALLAVYVQRLTKGQPEARVSARRWLSGSWRYAFWGGIVGLALAVPLALSLVNLVIGPYAVTVLAAVSVLIGGFVLRLGILGIGIKKTPPLYKFAKWRALHPPVVTTAPELERP